MIAATRRHARRLRASRARHPSDRASRWHTARPAPRATWGKAAIALAFLVAACGGQVDYNEDASEEPAPCHAVRGYFADNRCSERVEFDSCAPPDYVFAVRDFKCTLVRNP